jgi:DNA replication and repair protein RecF
MLSLNKITLTHFKNYDIKSFDFEEKIIGICGLNGIGKTNLLDAIFYSCFTKSYFNSSDALNTGTGKEGFRIASDFMLNDNEVKIVCIHRQQSKKEFFHNDVLYEKLSQHIGLLPCVMIAPDDIEIINGSSEARRKFIDTVLSQLDKEYLIQLINYNKILQQRNGFLKSAAEKGNLNLPLLEILDEQLCVPAKYIYLKRKEFAENITPVAHRIYNEIADNKEMVVLHYESKLHDSELKNLLVSNREKDRILQRTNAGIHRDDVSFSLNNQSFKTIASQGQKKSLLFALKLAEYEYISNAKGFAPILLLDDLFEKLDETRMKNLLQNVCKKNNGQVFITDTHKERLEQALERLDVKAGIIELQ